MLSYIVRRLSFGIVTVLLLTVSVYLITWVSPGDPTDFLVNPQSVSSIESAEKVKEKYGLNEPVYKQYWAWLNQVIRGNLGYSIQTKASVAGMLARRIPRSLLLVGVGLLIALSVGVPLGILSALHQYTWVDQILSLFSYLFVSIPVFFSALLFMYIFSLRLGLLPSFGAGEGILGSLYHVLLPALVIGLFSSARYLRYARSSMLEVLNKDYVRTARSKGIREEIVIYKHALRNAITPVLTVLGWNIPILLSGTVLVEYVYNYPGIGRLIMRSALKQDYPVLMGSTLVIVIATFFSTLFVDIAYGFIDPKVTYD